MKIAKQQMRIKSADALRDAMDRCSVGAPPNICGDGKWVIKTKHEDIASRIDVLFTICK